MTPNSIMQAVYTASREFTPGEDFQRYIDSLSAPSSASEPTLRQEAHLVRLEVARSIASVGRLLIRTLRTWSLFAQVRLRKCLRAMRFPLSALRTAASRLARPFGSSGESTASVTRPGSERES